MWINTCLMFLGGVVVFFILLMFLPLVLYQNCTFGYHAGGWGKPPVDEMGKPLYGDVFGTNAADFQVKNNNTPSYKNSLFMEKFWLCTQYHHSSFFNSRN